MKNTRVSLLAGLLASALSYGQAGGPPTGHPGFGPRGGFIGQGEHGFGGHPGKVVTGAPYSATATSQSTQTLADGNTISHTNTSQISRDSFGRTYERQTISAGPLAQHGPTTLIFISDPVAGVSYTLNEGTKVATKRAIRTPPAGGARPDGGNGPRGRGHGPDSANRSESSLGSQNMNGVTAEGKKITHTIPAGQMGNAQPITSTIETWYSPDLQVVVQSTRTDPRLGTSSYNLTNIQRSEPAATLFQIPSDYTVHDAPARPNFRGGPPPPPQS